MLISDRPRIDTEAAEAIAGERYGLRVVATELPSERDRTFRLDNDDGRFVLKIAHPAERRDALDLQHAALARLGAGADARLFPRALPSRDGATVIEVAAADGRRHLAQLLSWLPGRPYADAGPATAAGLRGIGRAIGAMGRHLADLEHPALEREFQWDARRAPATVRERLGDIESPRRRALAEATLERVEARLTAREPELRLAPIHNDVNDHNLLLDPRGEIAGIIDFGDLLRSYRAADLAHCAAYLMMGVSRPLDVLGELRAGYLAAAPLGAAEHASLLDLVRLRLCLSVAISARQSRLAPDDPYLTVSEAPAWALLARLEQEP